MRVRWLAIPCAAVALGAAPPPPAPEPRAGDDPLLAAARDGDSQRLAGLLRDGADAGRRHRELGTPLDAAERHGRRDAAALLRAAGAPGTGKSVGDTVCVRPWAGAGFCATVEGRDGPSFHLRLTRVVGCGSGCAAHAQCSDARPVGGRAPGALRGGSTVVVPSWCLTHTAVDPRP